MDAFQVVLDDTRELALLDPDDNQFHDLALATLVRVVKEDLGPVGIEALGGKRMIDANLLFQYLNGGTNPPQTALRPA